MVQSAHTGAGQPAHRQIPAVQGPVGPWRGGLEGQRPSNLHPPDTITTHHAHAPARMGVAGTGVAARRPICARPTIFSIPSTTASITTISTVE